MASINRASPAQGAPLPRRMEHAWPPSGSPSPGPGGGSSSLELLVDEAAARITRLHPLEALAAVAAGSVLIDIRSQDVREVQGVIPGSLHIPLTVLEWRVALDSPWRNPHLGDLRQQLILICDHGYSSILAAANLVQLGFSRAGDVIGGFESWRNSDLPIAPCRSGRPSVAALPGMGPPEAARPGPRPTPTGSGARHR